MSFLKAGRVRYYCIILLLGSSLLRGTDLSTIFIPSPGKTLTVPERTMNDAIGTKSNFIHIKGEIKVTPPKGTCIYIKKQNLADNQPEIKICELQYVFFQIGDLEPTGTLRWRVRVQGVKDLEQEVSWPTPYRVGYYNLASSTNQFDMIPVFFKSCKKSVTGERTHRYMIELLNGKKWWADIPEIQEKNRKFTPEKTKSTNLSVLIKEDYDDTGNTISKRKELGAMLASPQSLLHSAHSFYMPSENIIIDNDMPNGAKDKKCWFEPPEKGTEMRVECRDLGRYQWVMFPVSCWERPK